MEAPVWRGKKESVKISATNDVQILLASDAKEGTEIQIVLKEPLVAPLKKGQKINGHLVIKTPPLAETGGENKQLIFPIEVGEDLQRGGLANKLATNLDTLKSKLFSLLGSK